MGLKEGFPTSVNRPYACKSVLLLGIKILGKWDALGPKQEDIPEALIAP